jgi:hypothetical protein
MPPSLSKPLVVALTLTEYIDPGAAADDAASHDEPGAAARENRRAEGYRPDELGMANHPGMHRPRPHANFCSALNPTAGTVKTAPTSFSTTIAYIA